jgi:hypothetical protein
MPSLKSVLKKIRSQKLDGAALQMVIVIALVITIICSSLLLLSYYKNVRYLSFSKQERLQKNLQSAMILSLSKDFTGNDSIYTGGVFSSDTILLKQEDWGIYQSISLILFQGVDSIFKSYLIGRVPQKAEEVLYIADEDRPLSISGDSKITGDAYLPKAGIRSAYVEGKYYQKDKPLIYGKQLNSDKDIPKIDDAVYKKMFDDLEDRKDKQVKKAPDSAFRSFFLNAEVIHDQVIRINESYSGKMIFLADSLIEVASSASLNNVIICAPVVRFLSKNQSKVQVFARDSVILEAGCQLNYPSAICLYREKADKNQYSKIKIGNDSVFEGVILARGDDANYLKYLLEIGKNVGLKGMVDIDGTFNYEIPAAFEAAVHAKRIICKLKGLLYENYIIDLKLNIQKRPISFLGSSITDQSGQKKILQWLN